MRDYGLSNAKQVVLRFILYIYIIFVHAFHTICFCFQSGGSAGGLSTYLHLDRLSTLLPKAQVYGAPNAGYFLDHGRMPGVKPTLPFNYPEGIAYMYHMFNSSGALSQDCLNSYSSSDQYKCLMAPYAINFIKTPVFAIQSRFDEWQLGGGIANVPCLIGQNFQPPYKYDSKLILSC
eukprot:m.317552 g.317552  ORF g.317552 m.317552 type:complete len:177 (-) comp16509_c1_seq8:339-869(-)